VGTYDIAVNLVSATTDATFELDEMTVIVSEAGVAEKCANIMENRISNTGGDLKMMELFVNVTAISNTLAE